MIHRLTYNRPGAQNIHVRGYKEKGNIDTPLELAIRNETDRYSLAMDGIKRLCESDDCARKIGEVSSEVRFHGVMRSNVLIGLQKREEVREWLYDEQQRYRDEAFSNGIDPIEIRNWKWPY